MMGKTLMMAFALAGCAASAGEVRMERFQKTGLSSPMLSVDSGQRLTFVNDDARPHQVYSPDCAQLSSLPLRSGEGFTTAAPAGPRVCHFQDLLDPLEPAYTGAVTVAQGPADDWVQTNITP